MLFPITAAMRTPAILITTIVVISAINNPAEGEDGRYTTMTIQNLHIRTCVVNVLFILYFLLCIKQYTYKHIICYAYIRMCTTYVHSLMSMYVHTVIILSLLTTASLPGDCCW